MQRKTERDLDDDTSEGPSKTQLKKEMADLRSLGVDLLELPDDRLDGIKMEDDLRAALRELKRLRSFEARRRQTQYVGRLLSVADLEPLHRAIAVQRLGETKLLQAAERWRERLLAGDEGVTAWIEAHPASNTQQFRALIRNARREMAASLAAEADRGEGGSKGRFYRELFQKVRAALQTAGDASPDASPQA